MLAIFGRKKQEVHKYLEELILALSEGEVQTAFLASIRFNSSLIQAHKKNLDVDKRYIAFAMFVGDMLNSLAQYDSYKDVILPETNLSNMSHSDFVLNVLEYIVSDEDFGTRPELSKLYGFTLPLDREIRNDLTYALLAKAYADLKIFDKALKACKKGLKLCQDSSSSIATMLIGIKMAIESATGAKSLDEDLKQAKLIETEAIEHVEHEVRKCSVCGVELRPNAKFCHKCGAKIAPSTVRQVEIKYKIDEFVRSAFEGPAYCYIKVSQIGKLYDALAKQLVKRGMETSEVVELLDDNILGLCPKCGAMFAGEGIALVAMIQDGSFSFREKIVYSATSQKAKSLVEGHCPNCSSENIIICWRIEEDPRFYGLTHGEAGEIIRRSLKQ
ncbi:MAG: hypothetical protein DRI01_04195 [Chloroflexi bacterium]|nr:MAG: hypothetical protein DRI01_04195 [Chloroflexota bacterium]